MEEKKKEIRLPYFYPYSCSAYRAITSVAYIVFRMSSNRSYEEQWKDYDECGI